MYARIIAVKGASVDRRTRTARSDSTLSRIIRREMQSMPNAGPFMVERYVDGRRVSCTMEG